MTGPIRQNPSNPAPRLPPTGQPGGTGRSTAPATPAAEAGEPELARAPTHPAGQTHAGSSSAPRGTAPTRTGAGASGPALRGAAPTPPMALTTLAKELATLEQERATLSSQLTEAKDKRLADANGAGTAENRLELRKLHDRVRQASDSLQEKTAKRDAQLDRLERAEQQLASCERSLQALSIDDTPPEAPAATAEASTSRPASQAQPQALDVPTRAEDPAETAARNRVRDLTKELEIATAAYARADQTLKAARANVTRLQADVKSILDPEFHVPVVAHAAMDGVNSFLAEQGLPAVGEVARRGEDTRFSSYLAHFTEAAPGGGVRLKPAFQDPNDSVSAISALFSAMSPNLLNAGLIETIAKGGVPQFEQAAGGGRAALLPLVRSKVLGELPRMEALLRRISSAPNPQQPGGRRRLEIGSRGASRTRTQFNETSLRSGVLAQLLTNVNQSPSQVEGVVSKFAGLLDGVVQAYQSAHEEAKAAKAKYAQALTKLTPDLQRPGVVQDQLNEARDELMQLGTERRQREAAEAKEAAAPAGSGAVVTDTELATTSTGTDAESRQLKLRGDVLKHTETAEDLRKSISEANEGIRKAGADLRAAEDQLDTVAALHARSTENVRRERGEQGEELASLRNRLAELDTRIGQARDALKADPSRKATISDPAWDRAVERHVEPDDASLRARARITGYSGAYRSQAELARSAADIHTHVSQQPRFKDVMAATSRAEFERAVANMPGGGGVTDLIHDHGRPIGRGFSNDPDQTARPTELTQSNFSLQFVQGRVVVTHIYPYVPHRDLTTAV
jgi:predicted  nucleic acid-binding Zn-ribbon protein